MICAKLQSRVRKSASETSQLEPGRRLAAIHEAVRSFSQSFYSTLAQVNLSSGLYGCSTTTVASGWQSVSGIQPSGRATKHVFTVECEDRMVTYTELEGMWKETTVSYRSH
jgi:hypothetical protein